MLEKRQIENFLRINGVPPYAPDEEVRSVLRSALWQEKDIETGLLVLRENAKSQESHPNPLHKIFSSDEKMRPESISALLGVDMDLSEMAISKEYTQPRRTVTLGQAFEISVVSIFFSASLILGAMWYLKIGIFHFTMQ